MEKKCSFKGENIPFFARFCPIHGNKVQEYDQHSMAGVNSSRNSSFTKTFNLENIVTASSASRSLKLDQNVNLKPSDIPGLSGAGCYLLIPKYVNQQFEIYNIAESKSVGFVSISGQIENTCTPVFDGLFFNFISEDNLHRVGVNRAGVLLQNRIEISAAQVENRALSPLILSKEMRRYLLFIAARKLYVIDITSFRNEIELGGFELSNLQIDLNDDFLPLISYKNAGDDIVFIITRRGKIFYFKFEETIVNQNPCTLVAEFNFVEISYPVILENKYLYFLGKNRSGQITLAGIDLENKQKFEKETNVEWLNNVSLTNFPLHDGSRLIIKDPVDGKKVLFVGHSHVTKPIKLNKELNPDNFFLIKNTIYSLSIEDQQIHRYLCNQNRFAPSLPLTSAIGQRIISLKPMVFINGIIAVLTANGVHFYRIQTA